jgi:hypothetical protein
MTDKQRVQDIQRQLIQMTAACCQQHADGEYERLCRKLIEKMARKRAVPFFLFDKSFLPHATPDTICNYFQVSKRTVAQKAKVIRDMFKLGYFDPEFSTERMAKNNPLAGLTMVDGFLVLREP